MLYENFFKSFHKHHVQYVIIGGVAVNLHGYARFTGDLDLALLLVEEEINKFISCCKELGLIPRLPVQLEDFADENKRREWIEEKNMKVFSVYNPKNPMEHIDIVIDSPVSMETLLKNRVVMKTEVGNLSVASIDDLILLKSAAGRGRDFIDIEKLQQIKELKNE